MIPTATTAITIKMPTQMPTMIPIFWAVIGASVTGKSFGGYVCSGGDVYNAGALEVGVAGFVAVSIGSWDWMKCVVGGKVVGGCTDGVGETGGLIDCVGIGVDGVITGAMFGTWTTDVTSGMLAEVLVRPSKSKASRSGDALPEFSS